jgi:hypothetical protein
VTHPEREREREREREKKIRKKKKKKEGGMYKERENTQIKATHQNISRLLFCVKKKKKTHKKHTKQAN